ncbi:MAG: hypothetical protein ACKOUS_03910, partial [Alphaproteobacteria bacterium]
MSSAKTSTATPKAAPRSATSAVSVSGGNNALVADRGAASGVAFEDFAEDTHARLSGLIPGYIRLGNPADMSSAALGRQDMQRAIMDTIAADPN